MDANAYQPPQSAPIEREPPKNRKGGSSTLVEYLVLFAILGFLIFILASNVQSVRVPAQRTICSNNIRYLALAMANYESAKGHFPPAYIADENGTPMHSWRVLILPFIEESDLYRRYSFDEPWDGPNNSKLHGEVVDVFRCPSSKALKESGINGTNYVVVTGEHTAFPCGRSRTVAEITHGLSNTIGIVEIADPDFHWMKPEDRTVPQMLDQYDYWEASNGNHPNEFNFSRLDSSLFSSGEPLLKEAFEKLLNINDGGTSNELE